MDNLCLPEDSGNSRFTLVVQPQCYNAVQKDPTDRKLLCVHMQINPVLPVTLEQLTLEGVILKKWSQDPTHQVTLVCWQELL